VRACCFFLALQLTTGESWLSVLILAVFAVDWSKMNNNMNQMACLEQIFNILKYSFANILNQLLCIVQLKYELVKISISLFEPTGPF